MHEQSKQWREMTYLEAVKTMKRNDLSASSQNNKEKWSVCEQSKQRREWSICEQSKQWREWSMCEQSKQWREWSMCEQSKQWREMTYLWAVKTMKRNDISVSSQNSKEKWSVCESQNNEENDLSVSSQNNEEKLPICEQSKQWREMTYQWMVKTVERNDQADSKPFCSSVREILVAV